MPTEGAISSKASDGRRLDLDWLRIVVFGLLIFSHVGMYYGTEPWILKASVTAPAVDVLQFLARPWRLSLLFVISGSATAFLLARAPSDFVVERSRRLLVPLAFAMLAIIPLQRYYQAVANAGYSGGYIAFWWSYLAAARQVCSPAKCFDVPTLSHLWFVAYLWVFTVVLWALLRWIPGAGAALRRLTALTTHRRTVLILPLLLFVCLRLVMRDRYPPSFHFVGDWYRITAFFACFCFGFFVAHERSAWQSLRQSRWLALTLWLGSFLLLAWLVATQGFDSVPGDRLHYLRHVAYGINQWSGVIALLGFAAGLQLTDSAARRYLTEAIYPYYIVHYAAIIVIAAQLEPLGLPVGTEVVLLIAGTVGACLLAFELVRRVRWLRPLFGLRSVPSAGRANAAPGSGRA